MSSEENKSVQVQLEELRKKQGELAKRQDEMGRDIGHLQADARLQRVVVAGLKGANERPKELIAKLDHFFATHFPGEDLSVVYAKRLGSKEGARVQVKFKSQLSVQKVLEQRNPKGGRNGIYINPDKSKEKQKQEYEKRRGRGENRTATQEEKEEAHKG